MSNLRNESKDDINDMINYIEKERIKTLKQQANVIGTIIGNFINNNIKLVQQKFINETRDIVCIQDMTCSTYKLCGIKVKKSLGESIQLPQYINSETDIRLNNYISNVVYNMTGMNVIIHRDYYRTLIENNELVYLTLIKSIELKLK